MDTSGGVGDTITMLNAVIIGMVCLFAAIMVVNAAVAVGPSRCSASELPAALAAPSSSRC